MNKDNMKLLVKAIEANKKQFNMAVFLSHVDIPLNENSYQSDRVQYEFIDVGTKLFDCNSVGCIAGFATALANNWTMPKSEEKDDGSDWLIKMNQMKLFSTEANNFLGLTKSEGDNLYSAGECCIWKYLYYFDNKYPLEMDYSNRVNGDADEDDMESWDNDNLFINMNSISPDTAIDVLNRIIDGEIILANEYGEPRFRNSED